MMPRRYLIPTIIFCMAVFSLSVRADEVVLKTGKKFEVEKVWRENGQIWIVFHGLRVSIPQSKVERIESDSDSGPGNLGLKKDQNWIFPGEIFPDLRWGTKISAVKGLEKVQGPDKQDGVAEYLLKKENLKFGPAALSSIHCAFWRDRLYMVTIRTKNQSNFIALRDEVFRLFGKGLRVDPSIEKYLWTAVPNDMMLQYSKDGQQGLLWLRSSEIDRKLKLSKISGHASYLKLIKSRN